MNPLQSLFREGHTKLWIPVLICVSKWDQIFHPRIPQGSSLLLLSFWRIRRRMSARSFAHSPCLYPSEMLIQSIQLYRPRIPLHLIWIPRRKKRRKMGQAVEGFLSCPEDSWADREMSLTSNWTSVWILCYSSTEVAIESLVQWIERDRVQFLCRPEESCTAVDWIVGIGRL